MARSKEDQRMKLELDRLADDGGPAEGPKRVDAYCEDEYAVERIRAELGTLVSAIGHYTAAEVDLIRLRIRRAMIDAFAIASGCLLLTLIATTATVFVMLGLAGGVIAVLDWPPWSGFLVVGLVGFGAVSAALLVAVSRQPSIAPARITHRARRRES